MGLGDMIYILVLIVFPFAFYFIRIIETLLLAAKLREEERTISGSTKAGRALGKLLGEHKLSLLCCWLRQVLHRKGKCMKLHVEEICCLVGFTLVQCQDS